MDQTRRLFAAASELPEAARESFLREACAGDAEMYAEIGSVLAQEGKVDAWIPQVLDRAAATLASECRQAGRRLGPYILNRELGRGGIGSVWLAERSDDQFRKQVAIKLVKPGMDTQEILTRFRIERQILASLEHPNIARLLDGGATPDGHPYLVMEYVEGLALMDYVVERQLNLETKLRLFLQLSSAVEYAHQRMVVHRDLKSGNILITEDGVPKLLDFGIAKVLDPTHSSESTATIGRVLTPDYASPEQVLGKPITAATDVYSLGVVLFELLTGSRPYHIESLHEPGIDRIKAKKFGQAAICQGHLGAESLHQPVRTAHGTQMRIAVRRNVKNCGRPETPLALDASLARKRQRTAGYSRHGFPLVLSRLEYYSTRAAKSIFAAKTDNKRCWRASLRCSSAAPAEARRAGRPGSFARTSAS